MKYILTLSVLCLLSETSYSQHISIWQKGNREPIRYDANTVDSITVAPCDTSIYDMDGCDIDIDTTIVNVTCGGLVNVSSIFDGNPSVIKYVIYNANGDVIFMSSGSASITFMLPGQGVFYGTVEVSCGGGERLGGDDDEDAFEIINSAPSANFNYTNAFAYTTSGPIRNVAIANYSEATPLTYSYTVKELATGIITTFNTSEPTFATNPARGYEISLSVHDTNGCMAHRELKIDSVEGCKANFDWYYSWCEDCKKGETKNITVNFTNYSEWISGGAPQYYWEFGDGGSSTINNPAHVYSVPCEGMSYTVRLTLTLGLPSDPDFCQTTWDTIITVNNYKPTVGITKICCDGLVFFHTDAVKGTWNTAGSMNIPKWPAVSKKIYKMAGIQIGQNYRQYYSTPNTYYVTINGAESEDHNKCPVIHVPIVIDEVQCFNRNVKIKGTDVVDGIKIKYKFKAIAFPFVHRLKAKIKTVGFKKLDEVSAEFSGSINKQDASGCFCSVVSAGTSSGTNYNKRKAKAVTSTSGKFRIGMDMETAKFHIKTKSGTLKTYQLQLGYPPCDHPWFLFF